MKRKCFSPMHPDIEQTRHHSASFSLRKNKKRLSSSQSDTQAYQKFMKTSYILSNIKKAIKNNDIGLIIGQKVQKLRTQPTNTGKQSQEIATHQALIDVRRKYDAMKRERVVKAQQTEKLKERLKTFSVYEDQCIQKLKRGKDSSTFYGTWVQGGILENQYSFMDRKVFKHVRSRLKEDINFYKQEITKKKRKLRAFQQKSRSLMKQYQKLSKQTSNAECLLRMLIQSIRKEEKERIEHLQDIKQRIFERLTVEQTEQNRFLFEEKQAQNAILAKNEQQKNWNLLFLTHLFVKRMLINKIEKEMRKFKVIEEAYHKIKTKTVVKNVQELKQRFFNRNEYYGSLLNEVSIRKEHIRYLKQENARLTAENQNFAELKFKYENKNHLKYLPKHQKIQTEQQKKLEKELQTLIKADLMKKKYIMSLEQWIPTQMKKVYISFGKKPEQKKLKDKNIKQMFLTFLINLEQLLVQTQNQKIIETNPLERGKTQPRIEKKISQISIENNESIVQIIHQEMNEKKRESYKPEDQLMIVNMQRQEVIQNNQKFMRNLRVRYLEDKKKTL